MIGNVESFPGRTMPKSPCRALAADRWWQHDGHPVDPFLVLHQLSKKERFKLSVFIDQPDRFLAMLFRQGNEMWLLGPGGALRFPARGSLGLLHPYSPLIVVQAAWRPIEIKCAC